MIITKKAISRRMVLRGLGVSMALPLLDGMVPALAAARNSATNQVRRLGVVYVPNGMALEHWTPAVAGSQYELTPIMRPLAAFREQMLVLSGLNARAGGGAHAGASTRFLSGAISNASEYQIKADTSMDQILAKDLGHLTQLASLEVSLENKENAGACDAGYACAYLNTISWRGPTTPLPMETNPRAVFERLFGDSGTTDPTVRLARIQQNRSILDSVTQKVADLERGLGPADRTRLYEYLEAVRDVERRIQKEEEQSARDLPVVEQPSGVPSAYDDHAKLMFDLQVLAYQCDLTRIITFMMGREFSGRSYPEIGVPDSHHPISHHENDPSKIATMAKINTYHTTLFAYYLERLRSTLDGDGSLLDHTTILYGAGMGNSNAHSPDDLPLLLVGGALQFKRGHHVIYPKGSRMANLLLTLMENFGVRQEAIGDSTGRLDI